MGRGVGRKNELGFHSWVDAAYNLKQALRLITVPRSDSRHIKSTAFKKKKKKKGVYL